MKLSKKQALTEFHREQIIATAEKLFKQNGIDKTTMDDISKLAEYSKATLYVYFKNKDEIVNAITFRSMCVLMDKIEKAINDSNNWQEEYYGICNSLAEYYSEYPVYYEAATGKINVNIDKTDTPKVFTDIFNVGEQINGLLAGFINKGIDKGYVKNDVNVKNTVFFFWASLSGIIRMAYQKQEYLESFMHISKQDFLNNGYKTLLSSISNVN